jgi:hypothetical protein
MTNLPTGVSGKSTEGIGRNCGSGTENEQSPISDSHSSINQHTTQIPTNKDEARRENEARLVRNSLKEARRSTLGSCPGEVDELMLVVEDFPDISPVSPTPGNLTPESSKMAVLFNNTRSMSPGQFVRMMRIAPSFLSNLLGNPPPFVPADAPIAQAQSHNKILFTEEDEKPRDPMGRKYKIPDAIYDLFACNVHVPLTMTTSEMIERFHTDPSAAKTKTMVDLVNGSWKRTLLDVAHHPDERELPIAKFHKAWANMLSIYQRVCSPKIFEKIQSH